MSQDGKGQLITTTIKNDKPIKNEVACPCGEGTIYRAVGSKFAKCSCGKSTRCTKCLRSARKFGRGLTCGIGCEDAAV